MDTVTGILELAKATMERHPVTISIAVIFGLQHILRRVRKTRRSRILLRTRERVLVIGASSGIGRAIAHEYAAKGSRVCVVGRREQQLQQVADECASMVPVYAAGSAPDEASRILPIKADFCNVDDMVALREQLEKGGSHDSLLGSVSGRLMGKFRLFRMGWPRHTRYISGSVCSPSLARSRRRRAAGWRLLSSPRWK